MSTFDSKALNDGDILPLMESFYTIQGEGYFSGQSAHFLRIGGCDVGCHWCDVKESWDPKIHPLTRIENIILEIAKSKINTVVITGGEPLMWNLKKLTSGLKKYVENIHLETSGAYPISGKFDWICLSPKKTKPPLDEILFKANEFKVIINNKHDFIWAENLSKKLPNSCKLYLQPEWSKKNDIMPTVISYVKENPKWIISLQTHKYMNIP